MSEHQDDPCDSCGATGLRLRFSPPHCAHFCPACYYRENVPSEPTGHPEEEQVSETECPCRTTVATPTGFWRCRDCGREIQGTPPEPTGATLAAGTAPEIPEDTPEVDEARVMRYVEALPGEGSANTYEDAARAEIAVADEEQAELRAEVEQLSEALDDALSQIEAWRSGLPQQALQRRAEAAEADLAEEQGHSRALEAMRNSALAELANARQRLAAVEAELNRRKEAEKGLAAAIREALTGELHD